MQHKAKRGVAKDKPEVYDELYYKLDTKRICVVWQGRKIELGRMCSRSG